SWVFSTTDLVRHRLSHSPHDLSLFDTSWPTHPATAWTKRPSPTPWRITKTGGATPWSDASTRPRIGPAGPPGLAATTPSPRPCWPRTTHLTTPPPRLHTTRGRPSCGWLPNPCVRSAPTPCPAIPTSAPPAPTWGCSRLGRSPFWKTTPNCPSWRFCPRRFTCAITPGSVAATAPPVSPTPSWSPPPAPWCAGSTPSTPSVWTNSPVTTPGEHRRPWPQQSIRTHKEKQPVTTVPAGTTHVLRRTRANPRETHPCQEAV